MSNELQHSECEGYSMNQRTITTQTFSFISKKVCSFLILLSTSSASYCGPPGATLGSAMDTAVSQPPACPHPNPNFLFAGKAH